MFQIKLDRTPRRSQSISRTRATLAPPIEVSVSMVRHSRVYSSTTFRFLNFLLLLSMSWTKSIVQHWFAIVGAGNGTRGAERNFLRGRRRRLNFRTR